MLRFNDGGALHLRRIGDGSLNETEHIIYF